MGKIFDDAKNKKVGAVIIAVLLLFTAGFLSGWFGRDWFRFIQKQSEPVKEMHLGGYDFTNPLLLCDQAGNVISDTLLPFEHKVESFIQEQRKKNLATRVSVYFRELNEGLSFSIDDQEKFTPASLGKIPLLIAYLKWAETDPLVLKKRLRFSNLGEYTALQRTKPEVTLEEGKSYVVQDLLYRMIVYSDNNSFFLLYAHVNPQVYRKVYTDLGLEVPKVSGGLSGGRDYVTASQYASFFRILYNASYLTRQSSENALFYMSDVAFKQGLVAGVPENIVVSHKFGEMTAGQNDEINQMHDCGIVYYPNHPYVLCVMSMGESFEHLEYTIRQISHLVYQEVDRQYHGR